MTLLSQNEVFKLQQAMSAQNQQIMELQAVLAMVVHREHAGKVSLPMKDLMGYIGCGIRMDQMNAIGRVLVTACDKEGKPMPVEIDPDDPALKSLTPVQPSDAPPMQRGHNMASGERCWCGQAHISGLPAPSEPELPPDPPLEHCGGVWHLQKDAPGFLCPECGCNIKVEVTENVEAVGDGN